MLKIEITSDTPGEFDMHEDIFTNIVATYRDATFLRYGSNSDVRPHITFILIDEKPASRTNHSEQAYRC